MFFVFLFFVCFVFCCFFGFVFLLFGFGLLALIKTAKTQRTVFGLKPIY